MKRYRAVWDMIKIHLSDGPFYQGTVANYPIIVYAPLMCLSMASCAAGGSPSASASRNSR
ncbi:hypothetical protein ACWDWO_06715 [Actinopolymorpha singaporensis]|uniref:hypothetical protein n=1 Tax=Actinopolymorpha singaporensis TaxID=117157 RepID=UPI000B88C451|nr:hypothetical protein [Actinopolymorpha singaporensis]